MTDEKAPRSAKGWHIADWPPLAWVETGIKLAAIVIGIVTLVQALDILSEMGVKGRAIVRHGLVVDEISAEACGPDYGLIAVGAHSAKGWMRWLLDDVAQEIMNACLDRPILVVKA